MKKKWMVLLFGGGVLAASVLLGVFFAEKNGSADSLAGVPLAEKKMTGSAPRSSSVTEAGAKSADARLPRSGSGSDSGVGAAGAAKGVPSRGTPSTVPSFPTKPEQGTASVAPRGGGGGGAPLTQEVGGLPALAFVGGASQLLAPDTLGLFPCQPIGLEETVAVRVRFPGGAAGDLVVVQADDGGRVDAASVVAQKHLDANAELQFSFTSTREGGLYRITLRNGFDEKRIEFWGDERNGSTLASPASKNIATP